MLVSCANKQAKSPPFKAKVKLGKIAKKPPRKNKNIKQNKALKSLKTKCGKKAISIALSKDASLKTALFDVAQYCDFNVIIKDKYAREKLSQNIQELNINALNLRQILNLLINEQDLEYDFKDKVLRVYGIKTVSFRLDYISSVREGQSIIRASVDAIPKQAEGDVELEINDDNLIKTVESFDFYKTLEKNLTSLLQSSNDAPKSLIIDKSAGLITLSATPPQLRKVKTYLKTLQSRLLREVLIDVKIISVELNKEHQKGINWDSFAIFLNSKTPMGLPSSIGYESITDSSLQSHGIMRDISLNSAIDFSSILNFLDKSGKTTVMSSPKIVTLNNQQALFSVGDTINYQTRETSKGTETGVTVTETYNNYSIFIGILLNILPSISDDDQIVLRIAPSLSDFKYPADKLHHKTPRNIAPDTVSKKLSTVVRLQNGQTLVLGGLISKSTQTSTNKVSFLGSIPLLGWLFKGQSLGSGKSEIVFIIKPTIIKHTISPKSLGYENI